MPSRKRFLALAMTAGLLSTLANALPGARVAAATLPTGFQEQVVFAGLDQPTNIEFAPDGRVFVAEKSGVIKVFDDLADTTPTVFADLTGVVNQQDRGLLGMALAPSFAADPSVYVLYTYDAPPGQNAPYWNDGLGCGNIRRPMRRHRAAVGEAGYRLAVSSRCSSETGVNSLPATRSATCIRSRRGALCHRWEGRATIPRTRASSPNPCADPPNQGGALRSQDVRAGRPDRPQRKLVEVESSHGRRHDR